MADVTVITGGAGGMGLAAARIVGRDRFLVICDVRRDRLGAAVAELADAQIECKAVVCDITDKKSVAELVATASSVGRVASVIHTAGVSPSMGASDLIMRINAVGTVNVNEAFLPHAREGFAIVNVASMAAHMLPAAFIPTRRFEHALQNQDVFMHTMRSVCNVVPRKARPGLAYSLSKSFVVWYCKSQAARFGRQGARILSVSPGSIDTEMGRLEEQSGAGAMVEYAALKRFGTAEEIAEVLAFCASEKAGYLTGVDILCDGGVTASMTLRDKLAVGRSS
jgi:NAD(P)-dependent dehydrogenase (short-subunit alcohol dehydrogenase family)